MSNDDMDLPTALRTYCSQGEWLGIVYTISETYWVRGDASAWTRAGDVEPGWSQAYEARLFDGTTEVRWWQEDLPLGRVARVEVPAEGMREREWLLWGEYVDERAGWTTLAEARIGRLVVPSPREARDVDALGKARVALTVTEVRTSDAHGNHSVSDEILTRLSWVYDERKDH